MQPPDRMTPATAAKSAPSAIPTPLFIHWQRFQHRLIPFLAVALAAGSAWRLWREAPRVTAVGHATLLIQLAVRALAPGGTFYFTNIAAGNPYRPLIEYFGNWKLIERSEEDIYRYCANAGVSRGNITIRRDETGLALLVEIAKLQ